MSNNDKKPNATTVAESNQPSDRSAAVGGRVLDLPSDCVLVRYVKGPAEGTNEVVGKVRTLSIHTVTLEEAAYLCLRANPQFELVYASDRTDVEAASKAAREAAEKAGKSN